GRPIAGRSVRSDTSVNRSYRAKRKESVAGLGSDDQHGNAGAILLRGQRHLAHTSTSAASRVKHRGAQQFGKRERHHGSENTQLQGQNPEGLRFFSRAWSGCKLRGAVLQTG